MHSRSIFCFVFLCICFFPLGAHAASLKEMYEQASQAYDAKRYDDAVNLYKEIVQIAPNFAPAYNGLGLAVKETTGDIEEAVGYIKQAIAIDPKFEDAYENVGRLYYSDQDFDRAQEYLERALKINPHSAGAKLNLAWIYLMARAKPEKAISYFKEVATSNPSGMTYYGLGLAYFANNQRAQALDIITDLRRMGEEDYASRLEKAVRENRRVNLEPQPSKPSSQPAATASHTSTPASTSTSPQSTDSTNANPTGIKVRLRGKLSDI